jgi:hypothetical protein
MSYPEKGGGEGDMLYLRSIVRIFEDTRGVKTKGQPHSQLDRVLEGNVRV